MAEKVAKSAAARVRKLTKRQEKQQAKKDTRKHSKIPSSFNIVGQVFYIFRTNWRLLLGIVVVYLILNIIFASGLGTISTSIDSIKGNLQHHGQISSAASSFGGLIFSAGSGSSQTGAVLQTLLIVMESLVIIWALRHILANQEISVKDAYYRSMMPLIPFMLVIGIIILQLLPVVLGSAIVSTVLSAVFNSSSGVNIVFGIIFALLAAWTIYMLSSSIFALYIVTLPDMQPLKALRSAENLVKFRRWQVLRRLLFLPIFVTAAMAIIIIPLIVWVTFLAAPVFYFFSMVTILFVHTYLYSLYRSLLE